MTMENYEKKYKNALEWAKQVMTGETGFIRKEVEDIFPELKESEDEKIRKAIYIYLDWLDGGRKDYAPKGEYSIRDMLTWLEKQGEQKPADKVEPKFHKGEWITNGDYTWKIVEVKPLDYILQSQDGNIVDDTISYVDEQFHSFTIEDAKDGDVLTNDDSIFIFQEEYIAEKPIAYCGLMNGLFVEGKNACWTDKKSYPATIEQRNLLFKKMKDAGYEWDAEKKKLKKIENEIEIPFGAKDSELQEATYYIPKGFYSVLDGNKVIIKRCKMAQILQSSEQLKTQKVE